MYDPIPLLDRTHHVLIRITRAQVCAAAFIAMKSLLSRNMEHGR
jgi:hypothetical protein